MIFKGSAVALVTPMTQSGEINYYSLKELIDYQIACGTKAIIILGTTGESPTITIDEREKIIKFCVCMVAKRIPVIVGTGSNSTATAIKLTKQAEKLGADGALIVTPYYNKCNQDGLFEHYKKIAGETNLPIILYNVPSRTGVNILPETVLKLSKIKNIVGLKEASGNLNQISEIISLVNGSFAIYSGDDNLTLPILSLGAVGTISVTANVYPEQMELLCEFALSQDYSNARRINNFLKNANHAMFLDVNPIPVKAYMNLVGFKVGKPRLPLTEASEKLKRELKEVIKKYES